MCVPARALLAAIACAGVAGCATNPVTGTEDFVLVTEAQEISLGQSADREVKQRYPLYDAHGMQRYMEEIGQRLAAQSHRSGLKYRFTVIDSTDVNAFALPGGYVYISRGLLPYLNSEAELAGVIGHEIGHVTARHSVQRLSAARGAEIAIAQIFVPVMRHQVMQSATDVLGNALLAGYGRDQELQADRLGAQYLARAGYDPGAMIRTVMVLKRQETFDAEVAKQEGREPRRYHGLFATHPENDERLQQAITEAALLRNEDAPPREDDFLQRSEGLVFGESAHEGVMREGSFYHAELGIALRLPPDWRGINRSDSLAMISPRGEARLEMRTPGKPRGSVAEFLRNAAGASEVEAFQANGLDAAWAKVGGRFAAVVFHADRAYLFAGQARDRAVPEAHEQAMLATVKSFHPLTAEERERAQALRIRLITATDTTRFAELAKSSPLGRNAEGYLRLMNGMYPAGEPTPGQRVKTVE
jgi:predicted Zn-dependent protease